MRISFVSSVLVAAFMLVGCAENGSIWSPLAGESSGERVEIANSRDNAAAAPAYGGTNLPQLGNGVFVPEPPTAGSPTGTYVGLKVAQLREDLRQLQGGVIDRNNRLQQIRNQTTQNAQNYHGIVAAINARLQLGTTRGNPVLTQQWNQAQLELSRINDDIAAMNNLANQVASDAALSAYLLESVRSAYYLSGAIEEDHRQLAILEDEVNRTVVLVERLLNELSGDLTRQTNYLNNEKRNLTTLSLAIKNGEAYGGSLSRSLPAMDVSSNQALQQTAPLSNAAAGRPLVTIRFDQANVDYKGALYDAVSQVLERRPQSRFDIVAVTPQQGNAAEIALNTSRTRRHAEEVVRSLSEMGLAPHQMNLAATTSPDTDVSLVQVFIR